MIKSSKNWKAKIAFLDHFKPPITNDKIEDSKVKLFSSCCDVSKVLVAQRVFTSGAAKSKKKVPSGSKRKMNIRQNKRKREWRASLHEQYKP